MTMQKRFDKFFKQAGNWFEDSHKVWHKVVLINTVIWFVLFLIVSWSYEHLFIFSIFCGLASGSFVWSISKDYTSWGEIGNETGEEILRIIKTLIVVCIIFYGLPLLYLLITSFWEEVIWGDLNFSAYDEMLKYYTFDKVNGFYLSLIEWLGALKERLSN